MIRNPGLMLVLLISILLAQPTGQVKQIFDAINAARTNPVGFYNQHKSVLETSYPSYAAYLLKQPSIEPMQWDPGLAEMCRKSVVLKDLNPTYTGKNKICGFSSGKSRGFIDPEPIYHLAKMFTNIHNPDFIWFALYIDSTRRTMVYQYGMHCDELKDAKRIKTQVDSSLVDFKMLDTGANIPWMSEHERRMVLEINFVRAYPKVYAQIIAQQLNLDSSSLSVPSNGFLEAATELIEELNTMTPLPVLNPLKCVYDAAKLHGLDCKKRGFFNHIGSDGSHSWDRIKQQCPDLTGSENAAGNADENPREPVILLLIDDKINNRIHRKNMLDPSWKYIACYRYQDPVYTYLWIQNFAK